MDTGKIERAAVRAVGVYIDNCDKLESECQTNDKTPIWDGHINIYKNKKHTVKNFSSRVPLQIKGTTNNKEFFYRIDRVFLEAYKADRGCLFFLVQEEMESYKPIKVLYSMLSVKDIDILLYNKSQTIKIILKETPLNPLDFEKELIIFSKERSGEAVDNPSPNEITSLVQEFLEIENNLEATKNKNVKYELESYINSIKGLKSDGTAGWRDRFVHYSQIILELTKKHIKEYDPLDLQVKFGVYLHNQKLYHLAENYYLLSLDECRKRAKDSPLYKGNEAAILDYLGDLHSDLNLFEIAESEYKESLDILLELAKDYPNVYLTDFANTLNSLAILHKNQNNSDSAESEYNVALDIFRKLSIINPNVNQGHVATTLINLANLHKNTKQGNAESEYNEALKILRQLAKADPNIYLPYVALTLYNLAHFHIDEKKYKKAESEYKEVIEIRRKLAKDNLDEQMMYVAKALINLADLHIDLNKLDVAECEYKEALEISKRLAITNPNAHSGDYAMTLLHFAKYLVINNKSKDEAIKYCEKAMKYYKIMAKKMPQKWNKEIEQAQVILDFLKKL